VIVSDLPLAVVLERQCYRWRVSELLQIRLNGIDEQDKTILAEPSAP
jgi:hypothetical protein